jgi:hypothetical protein
VVDAAYAARDSAGALSLGDIVVVDGLQRPDGTIDATRIARAAPGTDASVRGAVIETLGMVYVAGVPLAPSPGGFKPGAWVVATGIWADGHLQPVSLSAAPELHVPAAARLSLEGYILPQPGGGFGIRGIPVRENLERQLSRDVIALLATGQRVQIVGVRDIDGAVRPQTIIVPDFSSPLRAGSPAATREAPATDTAARRAAAATTTETRDVLQLQRGVYGTTVARPDAVRSLTPAVPETIRTRPAPPPVRPGAPQRPRGG